MIVRDESNGELTLIPQTEHSKFVGLLAAHWGNERFASLQPNESVVRAAAFHDFGYLNWEPDPGIDPESGRPFEFRKNPFSLRQLEAYQWCIDWISSIDPYSGLLISMHRTGLWRARYQTIAYPTAFNPSSLRPEIEAFISRQEAWQEEQRKQPMRDDVWTNYHLLQVWDLLGLYFGCQEPREDYVEPVPSDYATSGGVRMTMKPAGPNQVRFDPYPFDQRPLPVQIACKRLRQQTFEDVGAFREAYYKAGIQLLEYELV